MKITILEDETSTVQPRPLNYATPPLGLRPCRHPFAVTGEDEPPSLALVENSFRFLKVLLLFSLFLNSNESFINSHANRCSGGLSMNNAIMFLGTGGDSIVVGKQLRASGGIILKFKNNIFLLDPGPGSLIRMKQQNVNPRELTAVFVSHNHLNHSSDVNAVLSAMTYSGIDKRGILVCDEESIHGSEKAYPSISKFHRGLVEKFIVMRPGMKVEINNVNIEALPAKHTKTSLGFKFTTEEFTISYTSDTELSKEVIDTHKKSAVIIINCKYPFGLSQQGHMSSEDVANFLDKTKPKLAIITHFGVKMLDADPIYEAREIHKKVECQVIAAKEGLVVNPISYTSSISQKRLDSF